MLTRIKTLSLFLAIAVVAFLLLVFLRDDKGSNLFSQVKKTGGISHEDMVSSYEGELKIIVNALLTQIDSGNISANAAEETRSRLTALKVPAEFKDLHLQLFQAVTTIADSVASGDKDRELAGKKIIEKIKSDNSWLN